MEEVALAEFCSRTKVGFKGLAAKSPDETCLAVSNGSSAIEVFKVAPRMEPRPIAAPVVQVSSVSMLCWVSESLLCAASRSNVQFCTVVASNASESSAEANRHPLLACRCCDVAPLLRFGVVAVSSDAGLQVIPASATSEASIVTYPHGKGHAVAARPKPCSPIRTGECEFSILVLSNFDLSIADFSGSGSQQELVFRRIVLFGGRFCPVVVLPDFQGGFLAVAADAQPADDTIDAISSAIETPLNVVAGGVRARPSSCVAGLLVTAARHDYTVSFFHITCHNQSEWQSEHFPTPLLWSKLTLVAFPTAQSVLVVHNAELLSFDATSLAAPPLRASGLAPNAMAYGITMLASGVGTALVAVGIPQKDGATNSGGSGGIVAEGRMMSRLVTVCFPPMQPACACGGEGWAAVAHKVDLMENRISQVETMVHEILTLLREQKK